jgi:hypothetical protein
MGLPKPLCIFVCADAEKTRSSSHPCAFPFAEDRGSNRNRTRVYVSHRCRESRPGQLLCGSGVAPPCRASLRVFPIPLTSRPSRLRSGRTCKNRGGTHQAGQRSRQFGTSRRGRGAPRRRTGQRDTRTAPRPRPRRGLAETCQRATHRSGSSPRPLGGLGSGPCRPCSQPGAGSPRARAWRHRRPAGGSELSGAVGLLWQRHGWPACGLPANG